MFGNLSKRLKLINQNKVPMQATALFFKSETEMYLALSYMVEQLIR